MQQSNVNIEQVTKSFCMKIHRREERGRKPDWKHVRGASVHCTKLASVRWWRGVETVSQSEIEEIENVM